MNPAHALRTRTDRPTQSQSYQSEQARQRTTASSAVATDDEARAKDDATLRGQHSLFEFTFPCLPHKWCQAIAERRVFGAGHFWWIAINMSCTHLHPDRRGRVDTTDREAERSRRFGTRAENLILMIGSLDAINAATNQIDQAARAVESSTPLSQITSVPTYMFERKFTPRRIARKYHNRPTPGRQMRGERKSQESAPSSDNDSATCGFSLGHRY